MEYDKEDVFDDDLEEEGKKRKAFFRRSVFNKWVQKQKRRKIFIFLDVIALAAFLVSIYFFIQSFYEKGLISLGVTVIIFLFFVIREKTRHK
ncbi:hypothetical protein HYW75_00640 [Candidatus Pacearchaeota archaeon]|nr:hypothetical protein [Candidatus Pacearchaeota archaeon]